MGLEGDYGVVGEMFWVLSTGVGYMLFDLPGCFEL